MYKKKQLTANIELTITKGKFPPKIVTKQVNYTKGESRAKVIEKAALVWLDEYINGDARIMKVENYIAAKAKAGVSIEGRFV